MFSRAPRFNYPKPEEPSPVCTKHTKTQVPPLRTPTRMMSTKPRPTKDMKQLLEQLKQLEINIQNRCDTMDNLCRDLVSPDEGFSSTRSSSPQVQEDLVATPAFERSGAPESYQDFVEFCAETVASLVLKKLEERRQKKGVWKRAKVFLSRVHNSTKQVARDFVCPKVVQGQAQK